MDSVFIITIWFIVSWLIGYIFATIVVHYESLFKGDNLVRTMVVLSPVGGVIVLGVFAMIIIFMSIELPGTIKRFFDKLGL